MMTLGIALIALGLLYSLFKGYVVWTVTHDVFNGGGVPTLDFALLCPVPLAAGVSFMLEASGRLPFPFFGLMAYLCVAASFWLLHSLFDQLGRPERERQLQALKQQQDLARKPTDDPKSWDISGYHLPPEFLEAVFDLATGTCGAPLEAEEANRLWLPFPEIESRIIGRIYQTACRLRDHAREAADGCRTGFYVEGEALKWLRERSPGFPEPIYEKALAQELLEGR